VLLEASLGVTEGNPPGPGGHRSVRWGLAAAGTGAEFQLCSWVLSVAAFHPVHTTALHFMAAAGFSWGESPREQAGSRAPR